VNVFAFAEGDTVFVEGYFVDGKRARNSMVTAMDAQGKVLAEGETNDEGQFQFAVPQPMDIHIEVNAGMGHMAKYDLPAEDFESDSAGVSDDAVTETTSSPEAASSNINQAELNKAIEQAVAKAMRPVMRNISEMREEKSLSEIVGGLGFIFGLMGVYFYLKARKDLEAANN
jgi:nickel transport protein